jgi:acyl transferase domain-containing protein
VLDDAYNCLRLRGIEDEYHQTAVVPPLQDGNTTVVHGTTDDRQSGPEKYPQLLVWSSADEGGIKRMRDVWGRYLSGATGLESKINKFLDNLAYTLAARRSHLTWRTFAVADNSEGLKGIANKFHTAVRSKRPTNLVYVFTGVSSSNAWWLILLTTSSKGLNGQLWGASLLKDTTFSGTA